LDAICRVIEKTPPDLVSDILKNGIVMTGGGSLIRGFDALIADITGIPTRVAKDAIACVARGTGMVLEHLSKLPEGKVDLSCVRRGSR
jgi:rod shape-determining protein MreB